jgi:hypothetical protein
VSCDNKLVRHRSLRYALPRLETLGMCPPLLPCVGVVTAMQKWLAAVSLVKNHGPIDYRFWPGEFES